MNAPSPPFLASARAWTVTHYKFLVLSFLIACVSLPKYDLFYSSGIDESLPWVYNYFADGHYALSQHLLFPHGRLAFLMYPLNMGNNLWIAVSIAFLCSVMFSMNLFRIAFLKQNNLAAVTGLLLILHCVVDLQFLIIGLTFSHLLLYHALKKQAHLVYAVFFCVFSLYIKSYCMVICNVILASELLYILISTKNAKLLTKILVIYVLLFVLAWLALYQSFSGIFTFVRGQLELSADNSEAVSLYNSHNWSLISITLAGIIALRLFSKDRLANHFFMIMLAALFAAWKHAMARSDVMHMTAFLMFITFFIFSFFLVSGDVKVGSIAAGLLAITTYMLNISETNQPQSREIMVFKPMQLYNMLFKFKPFIKEKDNMSRELTAGLHLPDSVLRLIGKQSTDVYPWNYSIVAVNHLSWQPRPVLQSYAAYTSWLDAQDAAHFGSPNSARFFIWELKKNMNIAPMQSIDGHYLLNDEPQAMLSFFSNYTLRYKDENYLVYEKKNRPVSMQPATSLKRSILHNDQWLEIPACAPGCVMRAKLTITKSIAGKLLGFVYKGEGFFIAYQFDNNSEQENRLVPKNAKDGLWLYPHINDPVSDTLEPIVKRIKVRCTDNRMIDEDYTIEFEQIGFNFEKGGFAENAFGKR